MLSLEVEMDPEESMTTRDCAYTPPIRTFPRPCAFVAHPIESAGG
jgi:hypothetical protein